MRCTTHTNSRADHLDTARIGDHASSFAIFSYVPLVTFSVISIVFLSLSSCAILTEEERAEREYKREDSLILAREEYQRKTVSCRKNGGVMQFTKFSSSRLAAITVSEYKMAQCVTY